MGLNEIINIGTNIKRIRAELGITQKEMAKRLNIPYSTYSNYENNNRTPSIDTLNSIAHELGVNVNDLFSIHVNEEEYLEFVDLFIGWATSRGYVSTFSYDDKKYLKNGGAQSVYIFRDGKRIEFTPQDMKDYHKFLNGYFDAQLEIKLLDPNSVQKGTLESEDKKFPYAAIDD